MSALTRWRHQAALADALELDPATIVADSLRVDVYMGVAWWTDSDGTDRERDLTRDEVTAAIKAVEAVS